MPRARADVVSPSPQPSPKRRGRFGSFCCRFSSGRLGISPASAILDCRAWPWLGTGPSATCLSRGSRLCSLGRSWLVSPGGHDDPAWGDSRIAPTRDSCGCSGIRPSLIESGTCFRTNRSCRLPPAHQGMRSGSCGLVQRIGTVDSATPHPDPSGGQAPALHFLIPPSAIGLQFGTFRPGRAGIEVDWRAHFRTIDEFGGGNHSFSYQSLMPAGAGTTRYARWGCWLVEGVEGHWCLELVPMWSHPHPNPLPKGEGDLDPFVAGSVRGDWASRRLRLPWIVARGPGCGQAPALHFLLPLSAVNS